MAHFRLEDGTAFHDLEEIRTALLPLKVELAHWPIEKTPQIRELLAADSLTDQEKDLLLSALDSRFEEQRKKFGYETRDLVVLHSKVPRLEEMLAIFDKTHRHGDDEVRYIIDGSGIFGFVMPGGQQALLTIGSEEYIRVPAETEHWFVLDEKKRIKAVRYFTSKDGWVAKYSGTLVRLSSEGSLK